MRRKIMMPLVILAFVGCAAVNKPTPEQIASANYGKYPDDYKEIVQRYVSRILIDPDSAKFSEWRGPSQGYWYDYGSTFFGYRICVEVNAKNRMGGYTGRQQYYFLIKDGLIVKTDGGYRWGTIGQERISSACNF